MRFPTTEIHLHWLDNPNQFFRYRYLAYTARRASSNLPDCSIELILSFSTRVRRNFSCDLTRATSTPSQLTGCVRPACQRCQVRSSPCWKALRPLWVKITSDSTPLYQAAGDLKGVWSDIDQRQSSPPASTDLVGY